MKRFFNWAFIGLFFGLTSEYLGVWLEHIKV